MQSGYVVAGRGVQLGGEAYSSRHTFIKAHLGLDPGVPAARSKACLSTHRLQCRHTGPLPHGQWRAAADANIDDQHMHGCRLVNGRATAGWPLAGLVQGAPPVHTRTHTHACTHTHTHKHTHIGVWGGVHALSADMSSRR